MLVYLLYLGQNLARTRVNQNLSLNQTTYSRRYLYRVLYHTYLTYCIYIYIYVYNTYDMIRYGRYDFFFFFIVYIYVRIYNRVARLRTRVLEYLYMMYACMYVCVRQCLLACCLLPGARRPLFPHPPSAPPTPVPVDSTEYGDRKGGLGFFFFFF